jgi:hypothetical protein
MSARMSARLEDDVFMLGLFLNRDFSQNMVFDDQRYRV